MNVSIVFSFIYESSTTTQAATTTFDFLTQNITHSIHQIHKLEHWRLSLYFVYII